MHRQPPANYNTVARRQDDGRRTRSDGRGCKLVPVEALSNDADEGIAARVVSVPCFELFAAQTASYRKSVIGNAPVRIADVVVAYAPGAQDTMMVLALALHLDPIFVGAHHLARYILVSLSIPLVGRWLGPLPPPTLSG